MLKRNSEDRSYLVLSVEKADVLCHFILKPDFVSGRLTRDHYHFHSAYEVHIAVRGKIRIIAEDHTLLLSEGDVCIIPPGMAHYLYEEEASFRVGFRFVFCETKKAQGLIHPLFAGSFGGLTDVCVIRDSRIYEQYVSLANRELAVFSANLIAGEMLFLSLYELACRIGGKATLCEAGSRNEKISLSEQIEEFLNENYVKKICLSDLAAALNLSERQTQRTVKELFDLTFTELLNRKRLTIARLLLRSTELPVEEIALRVGFEDKHYFYRKFHAYFDLTPGRYRKEGNRM
ncbi:MAG: helix-turn-helix domain-containing protein [Ruminococcaceae bacterium]|nr:helix-turn-helix domain-containing protein [Oscillospiraceae bacterium]